MHHSRTITVKTRGRGTHEITDQVQEVVRASGIREGLCTVFVQHTSASLIVCENADPSVRRDLESFAARFVRDGDPSFTHRSEGTDDMSAHVRSVFTQVSIGIPVQDGRLSLGTWQGVFLWEHRSGAHGRRIAVSVIGE